MSEQNNFDSELTQPIWAVSGDSGIIANGITYHEAAKIVAGIDPAENTGACIVTKSAADRYIQQMAAVEIPVPVVKGSCGKCGGILPCYC